MNHDVLRERVKAYSENVGHLIGYHDGGIKKQHPKVPRNKNPNKIWDGSEIPNANAGHK